MPSAYAARMSKRMSVAPRLSIIMSGDEVIERKTSIKEFLGNHVKTIATLVMIVGTILCIVLIVMVHKWNFENAQAERIEACLDVAIVGSGVSGSYAAWKLRHSNLKIGLFEKESFAGGRFQTWRPDAQLPSGVHGELGALFYLPQRHLLLNRTIHALQLTPREWPLLNRDQHILYLRGDESHRMRGNLSRRVRYRLRPADHQMNLQELKRSYQADMLLNESSLLDDPLSATDKDGQLLFTQGYWNALSKAVKYEGIQLLADSALWRSFADNGNAALLASIDYEPGWKHYGVTEGMDTVVKRLVAEFLNASSKHSFRSNKRLGCITKEKGYYDALFIGTDEKGHDKWLSESLCAKHIILAIPPQALASVSWKKFSSDGKDENDIDAKLLLERLDSIESIPALVAYFLYKNKFWGRKKYPLAQDVTTDLPVHWVKFIGKLSQAGVNLGNVGSTSPPRYDSGQERFLFMTANTDSSDLNFFQSLLTKTMYDGLTRLSCKNQSNIINDISRQLAMIYGVEQSAMPLPEQYVLKEWEYGRFRWKKGMQWDKLSELITRPRANEEIYVVGDAYCPGQCQFWAEGALKTVEDLLAYNLTHLKPIL